MLIETVLLGKGQPTVLILLILNKSIMVMNKIHFWHIKSRSRWIWNVACYISSIYFDLWDRLWLTTVCNKLHFIILPDDSFSQQDGCLQTKEIVFNSSSKQKLHSFQATPHYVEHNNKQVLLLGVLQRIEAALKGIFRGRWENAWPSVLDDTEKIIAYKEGHTRQLLS